MPLDYFGKEVSENYFLNFIFHCKGHFFKNPKVEKRNVLLKKKNKHLLFFSLLLITISMYLHFFVRKSRVTFRS